MSKWLATTAALALWAGAGGAMAREPAPLMRATIAPGKISEAENKGEVRVTVTAQAVDIAAGDTVMNLATAIPGAGRPQPVVDLVATDSVGPVPLVASNGKGWTSTRAVKGDLTIRYRLPLENVPPVAGGPPINLRIDGDGLSAEGIALVAQPNLKGPYRIALNWDLSAMGPGVTGISSYGDGDVELPAGSPDRLGHIVLMAGTIKRTDHGPFSAVWTGAPPFDPVPAMAWTAQLHSWMSRFFQDKTEPPYRVFMRFNPMNAGGGSAYPHSFLVTWGKGVTGDSLKSILGHEMTHTWTANGLGKWYSEGNAVFYQELLPWRAGLMTTEQYLAGINKTASRYYTNLLADTPEDQVVPRFWEDTRIRVLPYDRGAMYIAVLNGKIKRASGGKRSIDDLIKVMIARDHAEQPITEAIWLDMLRAEIGEEGPAVHKAMLAGQLMLPESGDFGPCFRRTTRKIRRFDLGFDPSSVVSPDKIIKGLKPDSEAAKAGLRDGDKIAYGVGMDAVQGDVNRTLTYQVTRDGKTFSLTYLPRGEAVDAYQWERIPGVPESTCKL
jgi:predicted metalloprotease with PDZ domain